MRARATSERTMPHLSSGKKTRAARPAHLSRTACSSPASALDFPVDFALGIDQVLAQIDERVFGLMLRPVAAKSPDHGGRARPPTPPALSGVP